VSKNNIPSKKKEINQKNEICENSSNTSTQADVMVRPRSGFRIRDQNGNTKYSESEFNSSLQPESPFEKGQNKVEKYNKEKDFVKDSIKLISNKNIIYKSNIKKLSIHPRSGKKKQKNMVLPPLENTEDGK